MNDVTAPFLKMALNNAWANATLYSAISGMTSAAFTAKRSGFFPSLCLTLNHLYEVDLYYLDALEAGGQGRRVYDRAQVEQVGELAKLQAGADLRLASFCSALQPRMLTDLRATERPDENCHETVGALLLHLFQHQVHHRGQAHTMILEAGITPPQLDDFHLAYNRASSARAYFPEAVQSSDNTQSKADP